MKLIFAKSEGNPNHCLKVVDDRPLISTHSKNDLILIRADPLTRRSKRESDSKFGMVNCKPMTTSRILAFIIYMVMMLDQILEMPLSFIKSFALMFLVNFHPNICFEISMVRSYLVEPHWIGANNLMRYLQVTICHGLRYISKNMKQHDYSNAD